MAFVPRSAGGSTNSSTPVTVLAGISGGARREVKALLVHNKDSIKHTLTVNLVINSVTYQMFKVDLDVQDTFVQDIPVVLTDTTYSITIALAAAATTQPNFVVTYAEVS